MPGNKKNHRKARQVVRLQKQLKAMERQIPDLTNRAYRRGVDQGKQAVQRLLTNHAPQIDHVIQHNTREIMAELSRQLCEQIAADIPRHEWLDVAKRWSETIQIEHRISINPGPSAFDPHEAVTTTHIRLPEINLAHAGTIRI